MIAGRTRPMTLAEIALLREVVRHLRAGGAKYVPALARVQLGDGRSFAWETHGALHWPLKGEVGIAPYWRRPTNWHEIGSITEAVDVLAALGYLPQRFSSAYRAGWDNSFKRNYLTTHGRNIVSRDWTFDEPAAGPTW